MKFTFVVALFNTVFVARTSTRFFTLLFRLKSIKEENSRTCQKQEGKVDENKAPKRVSKIKVEEMQIITNLEKRKFLQRNGKTCRFQNIYIF